MPNTQRWTIPYPEPPDPADVPADIKALADRIDALLTEDFPALSGGMIPISLIPSLAAMYQVVSARGQANGYPSLDASGRVPVAQLPNLLPPARSVTEQMLSTFIMQGRRIESGTVGTFNIPAQGSTDVGITFSATFGPTVPTLIATPDIRIASNISASNAWAVVALSTTGATVRVTQVNNAVATNVYLHWLAIGPPGY